MSNFIVPLTSSLSTEVSPVRPQNGTAPSGVSPAQSFSSLLENMVGETNESIQSADAQTTAFANGDHHDIHGTMMALEQADVRLRLMVEVRNHLLEAYREVMRMSV